MKIETIDAILYALQIAGFIAVAIAVLVGV